MSATPDPYVVAVDTGERIHYLDWGRPRPDAPALLLVHGLGQTGWIWAPLARRLAGLAHVLAPDLRGHGLSEAPRQGYDLESLAYDMLTVLVGSGYGDQAARRVVVAGHGFGAMVAATMARLQPESVSALALIDGGWEEMEDATGLSADEFLRGLAEPPEILRSTDEFLADRREYDPASWDEDQEGAAMATVRVTHAGHLAPVTKPHVLAGCVQAMFGYRPPEKFGLAREPVLVVVAGGGSADDEEARERSLALDDIVSLRDERGLPTTTLQLTGVGHNVMRYEPDRLAAALRPLLVGSASG